MRAVLDTNVFVSGLLVKESIPDHILRAFIKEKFVLIISLEIVSEIWEVLNRPRFNLKKHKILEIMDALGIKAEKVTIPTPKKKTPLVPEDPDDEKFLWCAEKGKANYLVSGDIHLLKLNRYKSTRIVTPKEFIRLLP